MSSVSPTSPSPIALPLVLPATRAWAWIASTLFFAFAAYYFIGVDQGATSLTGGNMYLHEFVHDARHFLGFPCH